MRFPFHTKYSLLLMLIIVVIFSGCASSRTKALRGIAVGMDKADVLEKVGNPDHKDRRLGQDRWVYDVRDDAKRSDTSTYIYFAEGRVTYVGNSDGDFGGQNTKGKSGTASANEGFKEITD